MFYSRIVVKILTKYFKKEVFFCVRYLSWYSSCLTYTSSQDLQAPGFGDTMLLFPTLLKFSLSLGSSKSISPILFRLFPPYVELCQSLWYLYRNPSFPIQYYKPNSNSLHRSLCNSEAFQAYSQRSLFWTIFCLILTHVLSV